MAHPHGGHPPKHGGEFPLRQAGDLGRALRGSREVTDLYGTARAMAWDRIHVRLTTRSAWIDHTGELPVMRLRRFDPEHTFRKPAEPGRLTAARVRRGFRNLRPHLLCPARACNLQRLDPERQLTSPRQGCLLSASASACRRRV